MARLTLLLCALGGLVLAGCPSAMVTPTQRTPVASATPLPAVSLPPAGTPTQPLEVATVRIRNHAFLPMTVYVRQGGNVTWLNDDSDVHGVTPTNGAVFSATGRLGRGEDSGRVTFTTAGEQDYNCTYHSAEKGVVMVVAPTLAPSPSP
jgi:plastocyanin